MIPSLRATLATIMRSPWTLGLAIGAYLLLLIVVLFPVLAASVGADDSYWLLEAAPDSGGSFRRAFWDPFLTSFAFDEQARMTGLAEGGRWVLALAVIKLAVVFSVPPSVLWGVLKVVLLIAILVATVVFLGVFRFRRRDGELGGFTAGTVTTVAVLLPLLVVLGVKAQSVGTLNGWLNYPTLTYGPFSAYLLFAAAAIVAARLLDRRFRGWAIPVTILSIAAGVAVSFDYELTALAVPVVVLVLLLQPLPDGGSAWARWRGRAVVAAAFAGSFTVAFVWIRVQIAQMACQADNSCYAGTVIDIQPRTLVLNLLGALPGGTGTFMAQQAARTGHTAPGWSAASLAVAAGCVLLAIIIVASAAARRAASAREPASGSTRGESRGLITVIGIAVAIALGATVITGISERAVEMVESTILAYRSSVVVWSALALAIAAAICLAWEHRRRMVGVLISVVAAVAAVAIITTALPANVVSAQVNRTEAGVVLVDTLHAEVALGDLSRVGDTRRCEAILAFMGDRPHDEFSDRFVRSVHGAYRTFKLFYGERYCSTNAGLDATTGTP